MPTSKKIMFSIISFFLLAVLFALIMPSTMHVKSSIDINSGQSDIYNQLVDLKTWKDWSFWSKKVDPEMTYRYGSYTVGKGAEAYWSEDNKSRFIKIFRTDSASEVYICMNFGGELDIITKISIDRNQENCQVVWQSESDLGFNLIGRLFLPFLRDKIENIMLKSLSGLKNELEVRSYSNNKMLYRGK